jgi:hypothetical protein
MALPLSHPSSLGTFNTQHSTPNIQERPEAAEGLSSPEGCGETSRRGGGYLMDWKVIGFEKENVFKAHPHPNLLHLEKEQRENVPGYAER